VHNLRFGPLGISCPPVALDAQAAKGCEARGADFFAYSDQRNLITPRSTWTPDVLRAVLHQRRTTSVPA